MKIKQQSLTTGGGTGIQDQLKAEDGTGILRSPFSTPDTIEAQSHKRHSLEELEVYSTIHWRRQWLPTPVLLPGKSHGWRSLVGCSPWVVKSQTQLCDFTFTFHFHALEKDMATYSSVLAWRIPGTGEPGVLLSMGSHRVRHD